MAYLERLLDGRKLLEQVEDVLARRIKRHVREQHETAAILLQLGGQRRQVDESRLGLALTLALTVAVMAALVVAVVVVVVTVVLVSVRVVVVISVWLAAHERARHGQRQRKR